MSKRKNEEIEEERRKKMKIISNDEIKKIVSIFHSKIGEKIEYIKKNKKIIDLQYKNTIFTLNGEVKDHIYQIFIKKNNFNNLPDFLKHFSKILQYLLNIAKLTVNSENDLIRFFFEKAPLEPFSTSLLPLKEFTIQRLLDTFEHNLQSNISEFLNNDWETNVCLMIVPHQYKNEKISFRKKKTNSEKQNKKLIYNLNPDDDSRGGGKTNRPVLKHQREVRNGILQIKCDKLQTQVKNCCFAVAVLVGKMFINNDEKLTIFKKNLNKTVDDIITVDEVKSFYKEAKLPEGSVAINQLNLVYENYLKKDNFHLVIFSKDKLDTIIYDSRVSNHDSFHISDKIIFLWLNDSHYDLILNPKLFSNLKLDLFCFKCMHYLKFDEYADSHICKNEDTCLKCYSNCKKEANFSIQCSECNIIFKSSDCFRKHLFNKLFKNKNSIKVTPCQKFFFVIHVIKLFQDFSLLKKIRLFYMIVKKHIVLIVENIWTNNINVISNP